jgi:hypothetical protein
MPYCLLYLYKDMLSCVLLNVHTCGYLNVWFKRKRKKKQKGRDLEVILSTMKQNWSLSTVFLPGSWCAWQHCPEQKPNHLHLTVGLISCKGLSKSFITRKWIQIITKHETGGHITVLQSCNGSYLRFYFKIKFRKKAVLLLNTVLWFYP